MIWLVASALAGDVAVPIDQLAGWLAAVHDTQAEDELLWIATTWGTDPLIQAVVAAHPEIGARVRRLPERAEDARDELSRLLDRWDLNCGVWVHYGGSTDVLAELVGDCREPSGPPIDRVAVEEHPVTGVDPCSEVYRRASTGRGAPWFVAGAASGLAAAGAFSLAQSFQRAASIAAGASQGEVAQQDEKAADTARLGGALSCAAAPALTSGGLVEGQQGRRLADVLDLLRSAEYGDGPALATAAVRLGVPKDQARDAILAIDLDGSLCAARPLPDLDGVLALAAERWVTPGAAAPPAP